MKGSLVQWHLCWPICKTGVLRTVVLDHSSAAWICRVSGHQTMRMDVWSSDQGLLSLALLLFLLAPIHQSRLCLYWTISSKAVIVEIETLVNFIPPQTQQGYSGLITGGSIALSKLERWVLTSLWIKRFMIKPPDIEWLKSLTKGETPNRKGKLSMWGLTSLLFLVLLGKIILNRTWRNLLYPENWGTPETPDLLKVSRTYKNRYSCRLWHIQSLRDKWQ